MALRPEMIDFIRLQFVKQLHEIYRVGQIAIMKEQPDAVDVRVGIKMIDPRCVERAGPPNNPVDFVALLQEQVREITSVLSSDSGNQRSRHGSM